MNQRFAARALALSILVAAGFAGACGGGEPQPVQPENPPPSAAPAASAAASAPPVESAAPAASAAPPASAAPSGPPGPGDWDKWSHDQKLAYMKSAVMPKMGGLFHDFDAKKYEEPKCLLCHRTGAKDGSFTMPDPGLPVLDISPAGIKATHAKFPKVVEFMSKQVEITMAGLIGEEPFDMKTMKGFGCLNCHTKK
jgi:hypothetical protein